MADFPEILEKFNDKNQKEKLFSYWTQVKEVFKKYFLISCNQKLI